MINLPKIQNGLEISKTELPDKNIKKIYDYFNTKISKTFIEQIIKTVKDERFLFFIKYGTLRRFDGDCEIIYIEIPQIPKKLVVYRRPYARMRSLDKFNLSRKDLPHIPLFEGEDNLKYLSLELNYITKIDQLISLGNLIYLNLYGNKITEIENLQSTTKLRVLLLGKNNIEKIKNVHFLQELEILDLHSNKIKKIENLAQLKKLRVLNLANNQISSIFELVYNKNLEELNIRKNSIAFIPNLTNYFEKLRKLNIGKNLINKIESLIEFKKLKNLIEIILEDNPVLFLTDSIEYLKQLPITGPVPLIQNNNNNNINNINNININVNNNLDNNLSNSLNLPSKFSSIYNNNNNIIKTTGTLLNSSRESFNININNNNNNKKKLVNSSSALQIQKGELNEFQSQSKINPIKKLWLEEYNLIISSGFNGYLKKRYKEINIDKGHVELEGEIKLNLFGNCISVLNHSDFHKKIIHLNFSYFYFDIIMNKKNIEILKKFENLKILSFNYNNIFSYYQLTKLENFEKLEILNIHNNEVCNSLLLKYFLLYRIQTLKCFNDFILSKNDILTAKNIFENFDRQISYLEKEKENKINDNNINNNNNKNDNKGINNINNNNNVDKESLIENNKYKFFNFLKDNLEISLKEILYELKKKENEE